jgi:hypothetical protein
LQLQLGHLLLELRNIWIHCDRRRILLRQQVFLKLILSSEGTSGLRGVGWGGVRDYNLRVKGYMGD